MVFHKKTKMRRKKKTKKEIQRKHYIMFILFMLSLMIDDIWTRTWSLASFFLGGWRRQKIAGHNERVEGNKLHAFILLMEEIHELARKWWFILWMVHDGSWLFIGILRVFRKYPFQSSHIVNPLMLDKNLKQLKFLVLFLIFLISNRPAVICSCNSLAKGPTSGRSASKRGGWISWKWMAPPSFRSPTEIVDH